MSFSGWSGENGHYITTRTAVQRTQYVLDVTDIYSSRDIIVMSIALIPRFVCKRNPDIVSIRNSNEP